MKSSNKGNDASKKRKHEVREEGGGEEEARAKKSVKVRADSSPGTECSMLQSILHIIVKDKLLPEDEKDFSEQDRLSRDVVRSLSVCVKTKGSIVYDLIKDLERCCLDKSSHRSNLKKLFVDYNYTYRPVENEKIEEKKTTRRAPRRPDFSPQEKEKKKNTSGGKNPKRRNEKSTISSPLSLTWPSFPSWCCS